MGGVETELSSRDMDEKEDCDPVREELIVLVEDLEEGLESSSCASGVGI